jgi:energy-coupling factor transporter ATP-binding protein EcfA2
MPLIELKDFNFSYASTDGSEKTFEWLHDINLEINYGDFVLL